MKKMTKQEKCKKVCSMYKENYSITEISKTLSMGRTNIRKILKENNIYNIEKQKNKLTRNTIKRNEEIIKMYNDGLSFRKIATKIGIGKTTVEQIIHTFIQKRPVQYNLNIKSEKNFIRHRKYDFDINFFEKIDTEEKAYWLGFLYADGCVTEKDVKIELQILDYKHLEKFKNAVGAFTKSIKYRNDDNVKSCLVYLNSKKMVKDLIKQGCTPRKTFILNFPTNDIVPDNLINHFMRGYFDGDGCIYERKKITGINIFHVVGCLNFIIEYKKKIKEKINKTNDVKLFKNKENEKIVSLSLGGNLQLKKIYDFLYDNATVYLERKKDKFENIVGRPGLKSTESPGGLERN